MHMTDIFQEIANLASDAPSSGTIVVKEDNSNKQYTGCVSRSVCRLVPTGDPEHTVLRTPSEVEDFLVDDIEQSDGTKVRFFKSDVHLILYGKNLASQLGQSSTEQWLKNLYHESGNALPDGASFDDIATTIKSRYIQSASELKSWISSLDERIREKFVKIEKPQTPETNEVKSND